MDEQYEKKEAAARFEAALKGARLADAMPMKARLPGAKNESDRSGTNSKTVNGSRIKRKNPR